MLGYILLAYVGVHIGAPAWYWVLLIVAACVKLIGVGIDYEKEK